MPATRKRAFRSLQQGALDWIAKHPEEFKLHAGKWAAIGALGFVAVGDSQEDVWKKVKRSPGGETANPLVIFVPGLYEA